MKSEKFTVIFLINDNPPDKVILLKRASTKSFAPNFYTGIGGKVGDYPVFADESILEGAYRELSEETEGHLTEDTIELREFARCVYENGLGLYYFWGAYTENALPHFAPSDGTLAWVTTESLLQRDIIPTTQVICNEWAQRDFQTSTPFTVFVREVGTENTVRLVEVQKVEDGLY